MLHLNNGPKITYELTEVIPTPIVWTILVIAFFKPEEGYGMVPLYPMKAK